MIRRRARFLLLFGSLYVLVGVNVLLAPEMERFGNIPLIGVVLDHPAWGAMWCAGGAVALVVALLPRSYRDTLGFLALLVPAGLWTLFYAASVIYWLAGFGGRSAAIGGVLAYAFVWSVVMLTAGWPNPPERSAAVPVGEQGRPE